MQHTERTDDPLDGLKRQLAELVNAIAKLDLSDIKDIPQHITASLGKTMGEYELPIGMFVGELSHGLPCGKGIIDSRCRTRRWDCSVFARRIEGEYVKLDSDGDREVGDKRSGQNEGHYNTVSADGNNLYGCHLDGSNHGPQMCCSQDGITHFQWIEKMENKSKCMHVDSLRKKAQYAPKMNGEKDGEVMIFLNN